MLPFFLPFFLLLPELCAPLTPYLHFVHILPQGTCTVSNAMAVGKNSLALKWCPEQLLFSTWPHDGSPG